MNNGRRDGRGVAPGFILSYGSSPEDDTMVYISVFKRLIEQNELTNDQNEEVNPSQIARVS